MKNKRLNIGPISVRFAITKPAYWITGWTFAN